MPFDDHDDIIRKVRALLAKAEDPACTPEEAKTFSAAAQRLIAKYAIEEALLRNEATTGRGEPGITVVTMMAGDMAEGSCKLLWMLASLNRCRAIRFSGRHLDNKLDMEIIGFEHDRELVHLLYTSLGIQSVYEMARDNIMSGRGKKAKITSFMHGYVEVLKSRFESAMRLAEMDAQMATGKSSESMALALRSDKQVVDEWVRQRYPNLGVHRSRTAFNQAAYGAGRAAGSRADLGGTRVGGGSSGQLGRG